MNRIETTLLRTLVSVALVVLMAKVVLHGVPVFWAPRPRLPASLYITTRHLPRR